MISARIANPLAPGTPNLEGVIFAAGVWVPVPRSALPKRVSSHRSYPVPRALVPDAAYGHDCLPGT